MALMTAAAYSGTTPPAGVTTERWVATIDGNAIAGIRSYPTAAQMNRYILFIRGGTTGADVQLTDTVIGNLEQMPPWGSAAQEDPGLGYVVMAPCLRGADAGIHTGGLASAGTDEFGGADLEDIAQTWTLGVELGMAGTPRTHLSRGAIIGYSAGGMRALMAIRAGLVKPQAVVLRAPFCNLYDWDNVATATQDDITAMIPGWTSASATAFSGLTGLEKKALLARSPAQWAHELPGDIAYQIQVAENDTKSLRAWTDALASQLRETGAHVEMVVVPSALHAFSSTESTGISLQCTRRFLSEHLS